MVNRNFSTSENKTVEQTDSSQKSYEPEIDKKKIFKKKVHYRNLDIENKLSPAKNIQEQDERELTDWHKKLIYDKKYMRIHEDWQKNLVKKKRKKAITKHNFENYVKY
jgi:hypothetical protein